MWRIQHHETVLQGIPPGSQLPFEVPSEQFMVLANFPLTLVVARATPLVIPPVDFREEEWEFDDEDTDTNTRSAPYGGRSDTNTRSSTNRNISSVSQNISGSRDRGDRQTGSNKRHEAHEVVGLQGLIMRRTQSIENNSQGFEIADGYIFRKQVKSEDAYTTLPFRRCAPDPKRVVEFTTPDKAPFKKVEDIKIVLNIYHLRLRAFDRSETLGPYSAVVFSQDTDRSGITHLKILEEIPAYKTEKFFLAILLFDPSAFLPNGALGLHNFVNDSMAFQKDWAHHS
jgi:hypothetical protein